MDRDTLRSNYRALVKALYEPKNYYNRVRNLLVQLKEPKEKPPLTKDVLLAVLRCFFWLGLIRKGRTHFWRVFFWTCLRKPESVQNFLGLAILGYHFCRIHEDLGDARQFGPQPSGSPTSEPQPVGPAVAVTK